MVRKAAKEGAKGNTKKSGGGGAAQQAVAPVIAIKADCPGTQEKVVSQVEEVYQWRRQRSCSWYDCCSGANRKSTCCWPGWRFSSPGGHGSLLGEAAKESYRRNKARLSGMDPWLLCGVADADNLYKMMEIEFERELNQLHEVQKSRDDMEKALEAAQNKSPL